jgi:organic radical activating enzyme
MMIRLAGVNWQCFTAGPHDGEGRTEIFCQGCLRAFQGNPCPGCFNQITWSLVTEDCWKYHYWRLAALLNKEMPNNLLTIGGGEPMLQAKDLAKMLVSLRYQRPDLHVISYTGYSLPKIIESGIEGYQSTEDIRFYLEQLDEVVDGEFIESKNIWNPVDGYIGSSNQKVYKKDEIRSLLGGDVYGNQV